MKVLLLGGTGSVGKGVAALLAGEALISEIGVAGPKSRERQTGRSGNWAESACRLRGHPGAGRSSRLSRTIITSLSTRPGPPRSCRCLL